LEKFLDAQKISARDNGRTPFQWDDSPNAGFTTGTPWLNVNPNLKTLNVAAQETDPNSVLNYFRKLINLRKQDLTLVYGAYQLLDKDNPSVYSYLREMNGEKILVMLNFKDEAAKANTGIDLRNAEIMAGNYPEPKRGNEFRPYEAVIYKLRAE
jgi:oligo-1,6-glucosidase